MPRPLHCLLETATLRLLTAEDDANRPSHGDGPLFIVVERVLEYLRLDVPAPDIGLYCRILRHVLDILEVGLLTFVMLSLNIDILFLDALNAHA